MTRFPRPEAAEDRLAQRLGAATEQLRAELEREAVEIIAKAREEAAEIEGAARREAAEIEREARERAASDADRISSALRDVDAMEDRLREAVDDLRRRLSEELGEIGPPPAQPEPEPAAEAEVPAEPHTDSAPAFSGPVPLSVATGVESATERNPVLDDMMRAQVVNLKESGAPREEAERFLARFKLGDSYLGMLDDVYSEHGREDGAPQGRRRRFGRRGA